MNCSTTEHENKLNILWSRGDITNYTNYVNSLKRSSYRVYRNSDGKHKVVFDAEKLFGTLFH